MQTREFYVDYFDKEYLDSQFPGEINRPHFQLAEGEIGGSNLSGGSDGHEYHGLSRPETFPDLVYSLLKYLKRPQCLDYRYQFKFSDSVNSKVGGLGHGILTEILNLHNDFVTPVRT